MKGKRLEDLLEGFGLPDRSRMILALAPGCMFGMPPPNLEQMMERVDCSHCRAIMGLVKRCSELAAELQSKMDNFCKPVREENRARQEKYSRRSRRPIIGRFARPPALDPEPDYRNEPWFTEGRQELEDTQALLPQLSGQDVPHWGNEEAREISREVVSRFIVKGSTYAVTL